MRKYASQSQNIERGKKEILESAKLESTHVDIKTLKEGENERVESDK